MFSRFRDLRERFRYLIDRAFAREFAGQLLLFVVLVTLVTAFGVTATLFGLFSERNAEISGIPRELDQGVLDAAWWALTYIVRLPALEDMYGASGPILLYAVALSILGLGVFGVLVSVINNAMRSRIELLRQGDTPVIERNHILILGWNNQVFAVLRQMARLQPGARVVILANEEMSDMADELRVAGVGREPLTLILRSGVPSNREELDRVAVRRAAGVIVLSGRGDDSDAIKTLVLLASRTDWSHPSVSLTAEIGLEQNYELAELGARDRLQVVSSSRVTSKIIVQTIRNPGLARIYDELMATEGSSFYVQDVNAATGTTFEELAYGFSSAVPVGISWTESRGNTTLHKAALNPEPDYDLDEEERLVLIARGADATYSPGPAAFESSVYKARVKRSAEPTSILLMGWTDAIVDILRELNAHATRGTRVTLLHPEAGEEDQVRLPEEALQDFKKLNVEFCYADATERRAYADLNLASYDSLVVLADGSSGDADTHTLSTMLRLSEVLDDDYEGHVVVELQDGANRELFTDLPVSDVVVPSDAVSAQLAQICRQTVLGSIYREVLSAGGVEISLRPAQDYLQPGASFSFNDLIYAAQQNLEIALGLYRAGGQVLLNPSRKQAWSLQADDRIIVLAQQIYQ